MKARIVRNSQIELVRFDSLEEGDCFDYLNAEDVTGPCMKLSIAKTCVDLTDGKTFVIQDEEQVAPVQNLTITVD